MLAATQAELLDNGLVDVSIEKVARRAGVAKSTIYRRWRDAEGLIAALLDDLAEQNIPLPDTGALETDLRALARGIAAAYADPRLGATVQAIVYAAGRRQTTAAGLREFFGQRIVAAAVMVERALARGELPADTKPVEVIRMVGAPFYYRMFITLEPFDDNLADRAAATALAAARAGVLTTE